MVLDQQRVGHSVSHRVYLADKGVGIDEHKKQCKEAYGNLRGVRFHEFPAGTKLESAGFKGEYWRIVGP